MIFEKGGRRGPHFFLKYYARFSAERLGSGESVGGLRMEEKDLCREWDSELAGDM